MVMGCNVKESRKEINVEKGFNLQKFVIVNKALQDTVNKITSTINLNPPADIYTITMELREYKSNPEFWFNLIKKENVIYENSSYNKRIVGYVTDNKKDIIILSDINNIFDFEFIFYKFIQPTTNNNKKFDFVYFDEKQYQVDEQGRGFPPSGVRNNYWAYVFQDNKLIKMEDDKWYDERFKNW